jgi:hypothetical protein
MENVMAKFTDAEAAQRLLDRLDRAIAAHFDAENLHSAERMIGISARKFLSEVIHLDTRGT